MAGCPVADYAMTVTKIVRFMIDLVRLMERWMGEGVVN